MSDVEVTSTLRENLKRLWLYMAANSSAQTDPMSIQAATDAVLERSRISPDGLKFFEPSPESRLINKLFPAGLPGYEHITELSDGRVSETAIARVMAEFLTNSPVLRASLETAIALASSTVPVLITGESGTGKEYLARLIHRESPHAAKHLIPVNCAAITDSILMTELFGYEPGAFTGAGPRGGIGKLEAADGGTLLLDEVAELSPAAQAALLRFLDCGEIQKVGRTAPLKVGVRVLASTHQDLRSVVDAGGFRADLYYRLALIPISLPPLRERIADLPMIIEFMLAEFRAAYQRESPVKVSPNVLERLQSHHWPGNLRELRFVLERAFLLSRGEQIEMVELPGKRETVSRVEELERARLEARLRDLRSPLFSNATKWALFLLRMGEAEFRNSDVVEEFHFSETAARVRLAAMVNGGILTCSGQKRGRKYRLNRP